MTTECTAPARSLFGHYCAGEIQIVEHARDIVATIDYDSDVDRWCLFDRSDELTVHETCADAWAAFIATEDQT